MKQKELLGGKYKIIDVIGKGGTSVVYLAENLSLNKFWAVKALDKTDPWYPYEIQEITILKSLDHPILPRIVDLLEDDSFSYIVMDYFTGTNLLDYISANGKVPEDKLMEWTRALLDVFAYLHSMNPPVIYRDMKPANLIVDHDGRLKLVDFGTARLHREDASEDTIYIGTQGYAAPEQYGMGQSDARTDLYNLGMTLFHLATAIHPLKADKSSYDTLLKRAGLSGFMTDYIMTLIQSRPEKRPLSAQDALTRLNRGSRGLKLSNKEKVKTFNGYRGIIALGAVLPHTGLTTLCLQLAVYFKKEGYHVALAEANTSGDMVRLKEVFDQAGRLKASSEAYFEAEGLYFYPAVQDVSRIPRKELDITILDLGPIKNERVVREFNRADVKMILCPNALWKAEAFLQFKEQFMPYNHGDWVYTLYGPSQNEMQRHKSTNRSETFVSFPFLQEPFNYSKKDIELTRQALKQAGLRASF